MITLNSLVLMRIYIFRVQVMPFYICDLYISIASELLCQRNCNYSSVIQQAV